MAADLIGAPKNHRTREIPLTDSALETLTNYRRLRCKWVLPSKDGSMRTKGECKWPLRHFCERAELRQIAWHVLRHTFASLLVMRGAPIRTVQELLGHADIHMTMRYAHL